MRRGHTAEESSARFGREGSLSFVPDQRQGNEVASEHDQIRTKAVDQGNSGVQRMDGEERVIMEIADQGEGEAVEPFGPARQKKILAHDVWEVGLDQYSVPGESDCASSGTPAEKLASCEWLSQKLKVACRSMRRTATPVENGPP